MKINGTVTSYENGKIKESKASGINVNFDRIMKVVLSRTKSDTDEVIEYRYCPLDRDHQYEARIDAEVTYNPTGKNVNDFEPGFSATVKLYNVDNNTLNVITHNDAWQMSREKVDYNLLLNDKCYVRIYAGYWKHEGTDVESNCDWKYLFGGYVNSSAYYRRGVDYVLELYCHNLNFTTANAKTWRNKLANPNTKKSMKEIQTYYEQIKKGSGLVSFSSMLREVIRDHAVFKAKPVTILSAFSENSNSSDAPVLLSEADKNSTSWFDVEYIKKPVNENDPSGTEKDPVAKAQADNTNTEGFSHSPQKERTENDLKATIKRLCINSELGIVVLGPYYKDGRTKFYAYIPEGGKKATPKENTGEVLTIYDFQNFLDVPVIDGSGCFNIKMMFNPECKPGRYLKLALSKSSDDSYDGITPMGGLTGITTGVSLSSSLAYGFPSLQGGKYQAQVAAQTQSRGYLFDGYYRMVKVIHKLSTHGNQWVTTIKTATGEASPR